MEDEYNAVTCKGITKLRNHQEHMRMHPHGTLWLARGLMMCYERATLVKTWLPAQYDGPKSWLDQLVYERALLLSRTAARKELLDQATSPDDCEELYEESLWCLYALHADLLQTRNPFMDEDRTTIDTCASFPPPHLPPFLCPCGSNATKLRLLRFRARMAMNDQDRLNDARADHSLADIAAPWDVKPADTAAPAAS
ncbi:hypothetical protein B0H14DRAFT_2716365 [Mycena olivaceomarginata]|nr:hypothetical protein B0H14DRAFT_2716365 [Mycena olivaceomarginata]